MANCVQNFKQILNNRMFQAKLKKALSEILDGSNLNSNTRILEPIVSELSTFIKSKAIENSNVNTYSFSDFKDQLSEVINRVKGDMIISDVDLDKFTTMIKEEIEDSLIKRSLNSNPKINGETLFDISNMSKITFNNEAYSNYLKSLTGQGLFKAIFINSVTSDLAKDLPYASFVVNDEQLNRNLTLYKEELWRYIYGYYKNYNNIDADEPLYTITKLDDNNYKIKLNESLFEEYDNNPSTYVKVLNYIKTQMLNNVQDNSQDATVFGKGYKLAQAYLKAVMLTNFDVILNKEHSDKLSVNTNNSNSYNLPTNGEAKYKAHFSWNAKTKTYDEAYSDISDYTSSITKLIANLIPYYQYTNGRWIPSVNNMTVGLTDLNSVGAILNSLPNELTLTLDDRNYSIPELFLEYDKGTISFNKILTLLIEDGSKKNNNLLGRKNIIYSLQRFLYGTNGISHAVQQWRSDNPSLADQIINPEIVIVNQIRNTVKHTYLQTNVSEKSAMIDYLDIDASSVFDYEDVLRNIEHAWKYKELTEKDLSNIKTLNDYINFLKEFGGVNISDMTRKNFEATRKANNLEINDERVSSAAFKENLRKLLPSEGFSRLTQREIAENLMADKDFEKVIGLRALFLAGKRSTKYRILTQAKKSQGSSVPTMGIANLSLLFTLAIEKAPDSNFFKQHPGLYKQTTSLSELVAKTRSIDFFNANYKEIFKAQFIKHFIEARINRAEQIVMPFNTSDKKSIPGIVISTDALFGNKTLGEMSSSEVKSEMYKAQNAYYNNLISDIYSDYQILDPKYFVNQQNMDDKISKIEKYLNNLNNQAKESGKSAKKLLQEKVNKVFNETDKYIDLTDDLHYSEYKGVGVKFNQQLKAYAQLFSNKSHFESWAEKLENKLLKGIGFEYIPMSQVSISSENINKKDVINNLFGEDSVVLDPNDPEKLNYALKIGNNGKAAEILKKFLWSKNLVISQYVNTTVKETFLHPNKGGKFVEINLDKNLEEGLEALANEEHIRTTVFTKRMNVPGASITIYNKGKEGILLNHKVAVFSDPSAPFFNPEGLVDKQKVYDGGGFMNPFFNELLKKSLPGYGLKSSQKPLAESISNKASATFKFATYSISNEEMRISALADKPHRVLMKKLNSFYLWDKGYQNLFQVTDPHTLITSSLNIAEMFPNYYIEHDGKFKKLQNVIYNDENKYSIIFEDGSQKNFKVDTLHDLWEAFGGEYSAHKEDDGSYTYNENSIQLVSSLINIHSIFDGLELRDKMIVMALPETNVKKGITNSNSYDTLYSNKKLSYFNFDTSFFGVQLDASHSTDESHINEITQVISLITEKAAVPELYNQVYDALSSVVERGLKEFKLNISDDAKFKKFIDKFIFRLTHSSQINNAKVIIDGLEQDAIDSLPLDDKTIYKQFISYIISETNAEFVRRKFSGSASVMRPSYGIIQVFEDNKENTYFADDLINLFNNWDINDTNYTQFKEELANKKLSIRDTNLAKINWILSNKEEFKDVDINIHTIRPLDHIILDQDWEKVKAGDLINLHKYEDFFKLKEFLEDNPEIKIKRIYTKSRDLKPVDITFKQVYDSNEVERSVWDTASHKFKYELNFRKAEMLSGKHKRYNQFVEYIKTINPAIEKETNPEVLYGIVVNYANKWLERTYSLLSKNLTEVDYTDEENPFFKMFLKNDGSYDDFIGRFENDYKNTVPISEYKHRNPENVHTNVNRSKFKLSDKYSIGLSKPKDFTLTKKDLNINPKIAYDVMFYDTMSKEQMPVVIEGINYAIKNNKLYNKYALENKEDATPVAHQIDVNTSANGKYRLDAFGNRMYKLPKNYKIFEDNRGNEIIAITGEDAMEDFREFIDADIPFDYIQLKHSGYSTVDKLLNITDDSYEQILKIISEETHNYDLKHLFNIQLHNYQNFKKGLDNSLFKKDVMDLFDDYIKTKSTLNIDNYLRKISLNRYNSFKRSLEYACARIPSQAFQSVMSMNTVGFIQGDSNDVYVSHWQLTLQGSDYDIDKLYMMGHNFENGRFVGWSPYFTIENFETSQKLPLPKGKIYITTDTNTYKSSSETGELIDVPLNLESPNVFNIDAKINEIEESRKVVLGENYKEFTPLEKLSTVLNLLNKLNVEILYSTDATLLSQIVKHERYYSEDGTKNFIVNRLLSVLKHPETQVSSSKPISFGVYTKLKSKIEGGGFQLNNYDGFTSGKQQEQNSIGKDVIGIAATGLKNYFALVRYFNNYYTNTEKLDAESPKFFKSTYTINGKEYNLGRISGLFSTKDVIEKQNNLMAEVVLNIIKKNSILLKGTEEQKAKKIKKIEDDIKNFTEDSDAALIISSILSLATDNAKELLLSKINAGIDFAGMHIYMIMLGIDPETVTNFMIDKKSLELRDSLQTDIFESSYITNVLDKIQGKLKAIDKKTDLDTWQHLYNFHNIYVDSKELVSLGAMLKVNQGSKATEDELSKMLNSVKYSIVAQTKVFNKRMDVTASKPRDFIENIKIHKPYLSDSYINKTLEDANKYNLLNSPLDLNQFFGDSEEDILYRQAAINTYNLIKFSFNTLDILHESNHFESMFKSFATANALISEKTNKRYFIEKSKSVLDEISKIDNLNYNILKNIKLYGKLEDPSEYKPSIISAVNDYVDNRMLLNFFKKEGITLDVEALMKQLGLSSIEILDDDPKEIKTNTYKIDSLPENLKTLEINNQYGLAVFRYLMEEYIIPNAKRLHPDNGFLKQYVKTSYLSYNLKHQIAYYNDINNVAELEQLELGINEIIGKGKDKSFNTKTGEIANSYNYGIRVNGDGNLIGIEFMDLLTMYNLVTNEGKFGGNRASNLLYRDLSNSSSISKHFIDYENNFSHDEIDTLINNLLSDKDTRDIFLLKVFGKVDSKAKLKPTELVISSKGDEEYQKLSVNRYYGFIESNILESNTVSNADYIEDLLKLIKKNNIIPEKNCN